MFCPDLGRGSRTPFVANRLALPYLLSILILLHMCGWCKLGRLHRAVFLAKTDSKNATTYNALARTSVSNTHCSWA